MSRRTLVSLVSDQPAPNLMLILDPAFAGMDRYLFVSTPRMNAGRQLDNLLAAARLPAHKVERITVPADDPAGIQQVLKEACRPEGESYRVNLTGGTKVMGFALGHFFADNKAFRAEMFYVGLGQNVYRKIYPFDQIATQALTYRFSLSTYLTAYGIQQQEIPVAYHRKLELEQLMFKASLEGNRLPLSEQQAIWWYASHLDDFRRKKLRAKEIPITAKAWVTEYLDYIGYQTLQEGVLGKEELRYLKSAWLEHYIRELIQQELDLPEDATAVGVKLYPDGSDWKYRNNEFDVLFMYENRLHIVECKTAMRRKREETKVIFNNALYKIAALKRDFGLNVKVSLVTLSDQLREDKKGKRVIIPDYNLRAELFDMPVIDHDMLAATPRMWLPHLLRGSGLAATTGV